MRVRLVVNGVPAEAEVREGESLLDLLRERLGLRAAKRGCPPQGQCGACLAIVNGEPRATCTLSAAGAHGLEVLTVEGLPAADRERFARAFAVAGGHQCGFCLPGIVLRAWWLLQRDAAPTRAGLAAALDEHLCRCTGYVKILDALMLVAGARRGEPIPEPLDEGGVGARIARLQARALTLGERAFVDDRVAPGMLHGALRLADHARARVIRIDPSRARAAPGVVLVVTAADVPGERWQGLIERDWPVLVAEGEETRCVGDVLAAVAAESEAEARAAAALVEVHAEALPALLDPEQALAPGAPQVNPRHANLLGRSFLRRGEPERALATSAHVVSGTWRTQRVEHLFLEPESALAIPGPDGALHLHTHGQGIFDDRRQVASLLGIDEERVFVELSPSGGAFGGKEDLTVQAHAALLAWHTRRPVRVTLSRGESIRLHPKRHPMRIDLTAGCDAEGRLTAVRARFVGDSGAYASVGAKVLERAAGHACGPYRVPHVEVEGLAVYTNHPPCGAMRGFGAPQAAFAIEGALDELADRAGIDRWEMRFRNAVQVGDPVTSGQILERSPGVKETLRAVKPHWDEALRAGRAVGIACGIKNCGLGNGAEEFGRAVLRVEADGTVSLFTGYTEMGQGLLTVLAQIASEASGVPVGRFRPRVDATYALGCGQTTGSRATLLGGRAVERAARALGEALAGGQCLERLAGRVFHGEVVVSDTTPFGAAAERPRTHTTYGFATQLCILDPRGRLERVVAAHDVGRAINPTLCEGQIEGAVHMGLGYALSEELPCADGMPVTTSLYQLGVLRARHVPAVDVILVEDPEPEGPYGAKGLGEIGLVPTAAAVAGALEAFDGIRRRALPMKDSPAARALSVGKIRSRAPRESWR